MPSSDGIEGSLKQNKSDISGILHQNKNKLNYDLRRYFPEGAVADLVEQYWYVDWTLEVGKEHVQQNLPDPNFHLVFDSGNAKLIGPVSKVFCYKMANSGKVLGVKFKAGALADFLPAPLAEFVNQELIASNYFTERAEALAYELSHDLPDQVIFNKMQHFLAPFVQKPSRQQLAVSEQLELIKSTPEITSVQQLSERTHVGVRSLQRNFTKYLGLSPKWLIRKYRLHQALSELEKHQVEICDLVVRLGYTDQSHLIRDFKDFLGTTPRGYKMESSVDK